MIQIQNFREMGNLKYCAVKYKYVNIAKKWRENFNNEVSTK